VVSTRITPVIICGGAGTRLWPVSRESLPKQFVPLVGTSSTFQQVLERVAEADLFAAPMVITHADSRFIVAEQMRAVGVTADIILEPCRRDSGPAIAVAAEFASRREPDANVLILPADHLIRDAAGFQSTCRQALPSSQAGRIVTFGIRPTFPASGYGYIRPGAQLSGTAALAVEAFVEKPDTATAA
jgi:mannose-1-phosphate guanylyltransferase / mannose-6-phosphate isomerase